jgi:hypothetical protein
VTAGWRATWAAESVRSSQEQRSCDLPNSRWLAGHFGLIHRDVLSYWFPVYDPAAKEVSPGRLLLWRTLQSADALGLRMIDRGEGDNQAKRDFFEFDDVSFNLPIATFAADPAPESMGLGLFGIGLLGLGFVRRR